jgi:hypothetical protein
MKKITLIAIALTMASLAAQAQGLVGFANTINAGTKISVNSTTGGTATGLMPAGAGNFYFALFYSTTATTVEGSALSLIPQVGNNEAASWVWSDANWHFAGNGGPYNDNGTMFTSSGYAQSTSTAGRLAGLAPDAVGGLAGGASAQFVVVGWSSNLGSTWGAVQTLINSGGPSVAGSYYLGESIVSATLTAGDNSLVLSPSIFGASGATPGFTLGLVNVPEPSTIALAGLGGLSLLLFRRRK